MSSLHRAWSIGPVQILISAAVLVSSGCHHAQSPAVDPSVARSSGETVSPTYDGKVTFAGVDIVPTSRFGFRVRIQSALVGDGEPLYVIDGVRMTIPPNRGIDWFKPEDIATIKVLKLPHELAEYGPSGVNGVIVITTKQALARRQR